MAAGAALMAAGRGSDRVGVAGQDKEKVDKYSSRYFLPTYNGALESRSRTVFEFHCLFLINRNILKLINKPKPLVETGEGYFICLIYGIYHII